MIEQFFSLVGEEMRFSLTMLRHQVTAKNITHPKVLVNGSPKSGTTWMLKMLASIPGHEDAGNFSGDHKRYDAVSPGQVIHGHETYTDALKSRLEKNGIRVILMIRDPRDQLVSRMFHVRRSPNHPWHERLQKMTIDEALMICIEGREQLPATDVIISLTQSWLEVGNAACIVRYEELLDNTVFHFQRVLDYMGIQGDRRLAEVVVERNRFSRLSIGKKVWLLQRMPGEEDPKSHFRKGIKGDWRNYLKPHHIARFKEVSGQQLIDLGYETDLDW